MTREWSCEHCGRPTRDAPWTCDANGCAICWACLSKHDHGADLPCVTDTEDFASTVNPRKPGTLIGNQRGGK